jgi:hypothetical protein
MINFKKFYQNLIEFHRVCIKIKVIKPTKKEKVKKLIFGIFKAGLYFGYEAKNNYMGLCKWF